ncbi:hypothetical protein [Actinomadura litoris]|uniref:hypothetical protein n=1 Tax=Actinomadura litoris TaxID=2678616 RepID=UPI001FA7958D|nr:hypothetical protein [Actinomadura litoris]
MNGAAPSSGLPADADGRDHRSPPSPPPQNAAPSPNGTDRSSHQNHDLAALTTGLITAYGATPTEVRAILADAARDGIRNLAAWINSDAGRQDFPRRLTRHRQHATSATQATQLRAAIDACPWCDHHGHLDHGDHVRKCDHTTPPPPAVRNDSNDSNDSNDHRAPTDVLAELRKAWRRRPPSP